MEKLRELDNAHLTVTHLQEENKRIKGTMAMMSKALQRGPGESYAFIIEGENK